MHGMPSPQNEVRWRRARATMQTMPSGQPRVHLRRVKSRQALLQVRTFFTSPTLFIFPRYHHPRLHSPAPTPPFFLLRPYADRSMLTVLFSLRRVSRKHEILTRSLRKMERTLDTVLRSIGNPSIASGMISRSPSPDSANAATSSRHGTQALLARSPSPSLGLSAAGGSSSAGPTSGTGGINPNATQNHSSQYASPTTSFSGPSHNHTGSGQAPIRPKQQPGSPKLHSLPDNSLNPLGLLAEASLANRRAQQQASAGGHGL